MPTKMSQRALAARVCYQALAMVQALCSVCEVVYQGRSTNCISNWIHSWRGWAEQCIQLFLLLRALYNDMLYCLTTIAL